MHQLFGDTLAPITSTIGFLQCDLLQATERFVSWQRSIHEKRSVSLSSSEIHGDFYSVLHRLLPLNSVETRRYLFISTRSNWIAFLDNGHRGTDAFPPMSYLALKLGCKALRATCVAKGRKWPATILEIYGPEQTDFLNCIRSVDVAYDGTRWSFSQAGQIQAFEDVEKYSSKRIEERFTPNMLDVYLEALGISMFDPSFYLPEGKSAILVEKTGPIASAAREFTLEELG